MSNPFVWELPDPQWGDLLDPEHIHDYVWEDEE